jgi:hypothetical protein
VSSRGPAQAGTAGAGGGKALVGSFDDELADELGQGGEDMEDQPTAGVVVSKASCSEVKPMPRLRRPATIVMRS